MRGKRKLFLSTAFAALLGVGAFAGFSLSKESAKPAEVEATVITSGNIYRFTQNQGWSGDVYAYAYGGSADSMNWPGVKLGFAYNSGNEKVYVYPTSGTPGTIIFHNYSNARATVNPSSSNKAWYMTGDAGTSTDGQENYNTSTWTPTNNTYYFYDYHNSFKTTGLCAYAYGSGHGYENHGWPGVAMSVVSGSSGHLYSISVDPMFDKLIINNNNNGKQTSIDNDWTNKKSGQCLAAYTEDAMPTSWSTDMDDIYANDWVFQFMHFREISTSDNTDTSACKGSTGYYQKAKTAYQSYSPAIKTKISGYGEWGDAQARLSAWARANGETVTFSGTTLTINAVKIPYVDVTNNASTTIIVIVISSIALAAIGGYFLFRKKKEN